MHPETNFRELFSFNDSIVQDPPTLKIFSRITMLLGIFKSFGTGSPAMVKSKRRSVTGYKTLFAGMFVAFSLAIISSPAYAVLVGGVDFPQGNASFADTVVAYAPAIVNGEPTYPYRGASNALGPPDYAGAACTTQADCTFVSLVGADIGARGAFTTVLTFVVPEPSTLLLIGIGLAVLAAWARRKTKP